jgi:hypothetical protein
MPKLPDTHHRKPATKSAFHVKKNSAAIAPMWNAAIKKDVTQLTWLPLDCCLVSAWMLIVPFTT